MTTRCCECGRYLGQTDQSYDLCEHCEEDYGGEHPDLRNDPYALTDADAA